MKKASTKTSSVKRPIPRIRAAKEPARQAGRKRATPKRAKAAATSTERDALALAMTALLEISAETRDLLIEIRDALLEIPDELEPGEVDTVVISETEPPESSEEEF